MGSTRFALFLAFAGWVSTAQAAQDELARIPANVGSDTSYQGMHSDLGDDEPVNRFMDLLAAGAVIQARA